MARRVLLRLNISENTHFHGHTDLDKHFATFFPSSFTRGEDTYFKL